MFETVFGKTPASSGWGRLGETDFYVLPLNLPQHAAAEMPATRPCLAHHRALVAGFPCHDSWAGLLMQLEREDRTKRFGESSSSGELAKRAGMSRSTFALRLNEKVGPSDMEYLTRWRMLRAGDRLSTLADSFRQSLFSRL
jgi:AraC-like DNA-binding protein